jgi:hypothetical protein
MLLASIMLVLLCVVIMVVVVVLFRRGYEITDSVVFLSMFIFVITGTSVLILSTAYHENMRRHACIEAHGWWVVVDKYVSETSTDYGNGMVITSLDTVAVHGLSKCR